MKFNSVSALFELDQIKRVVLPVSNYRGSTAPTSTDLMDDYIEVTGNLGGEAPTVRGKSIKALVKMAVVNRGGSANGNPQAASDIVLRQSLNDFFFAPSFYVRVNKNSRWLSMEEIITHFLFYSEGPVLPSGFSLGGVEAPKGHLGVSVVSLGGNKLDRVRIRSSIQTMAGQITGLVHGVSLGDFVVIVSGSNIVVGEIDR